jgi:hypothetical protein
VNQGTHLAAHHDAVISGVALSTCAFLTSGDRGQTSDRGDHGLEVREFQSEGVHALAIR